MQAPSTRISFWRTSTPTLRSPQRPASKWLALVGRLQILDKGDITPELASRLVARQFPQWADLPVSRVELDGWDNTTFRLGTTMSVRLPSADAYVAQIDKEHRWLPILRGNLP